MRMLVGAMLASGVLAAAGRLPVASHSSMMRSSAGGADQAAVRDQKPPMYQVDPYWPRPLPNRWIIGAVAGVAVDARDHIWITHRPSTLQPNELRSGWKAAPPVIEFDRDG